MSFPTLQVRPNERNPKILRAHEFLRQSNQLVERNLINNEGKKVLARMLTKMVAEAKAIYALDEKRTDSRKSVILLEQLKTAHQTSISVMEDRFVNADLARRVAEKKLAVQKKYSEIEHLRKWVQVKKGEIQREIEKNEKRVASICRANEEMSMRSSAILKHLENSEDVAKLRKMEEQKREMEEEVHELREHKQALSDQISTNRATLKAESKKSFKKMVIDCAKHYKLCQSLTPKLLNSQRNVQALKEEEEIRRASGSLDETIPFDRSFVLASMESQTPSSVRRLLPPLQLEISEKPSESSFSVERVVETAKSPPRSVAAERIVVETQRIERQVTPEEEMEEESKDTSVDVMEQQPMEQDEPVAQQPPPPIPASPSLSAASQTSSSAVSQQGNKTSTHEVENETNDEADALLRDVAARLEEAEEEVMSENGSNKDDNFSFNFFGNSNRNGANEAENGSGNESEANFDFNFGGEETAAGGGGVFDFLGGTEGNAAASGDSDPFGFAKTGNGGSGGGDMSFNFNFEGAEKDAAAAANSTFFNF